MIELNCRVQENPEPLTVGSLIAVRCDGDVSAINVDTSTVSLADADLYKFKVLKAQKEGGALQLQVTSYEPGNHQFAEIKMIDGDTQYSLKNIQYTVTSVIDPQDPPKGPFPPMGPFTISWPVYVYIVLASLLLALLGPIIWSMLRRRRFKSWLKQMDVVGKQDQASSQYFFAARKLNSSKSENISVGEKLATLENEFMIWLAKKFQIPSLKIGPDKTVKMIATKNKSLMVETENNLKKIINEFQKIKKSETKHQKDFEQMYRTCQRFIDQTDKILKDSRGKNAV